jgi:hypothetical protein
MTSGPIRPPSTRALSRGLLAATLCCPLSCSDASPGTDFRRPPHHHTGHTPDEARGIDLQEHTQEANAPETLCDEPLLSVDFELEPESQLRTLYVDASSSTTTATGSMEAPFQTIVDAIAQVEGFGVVLVAGGNYELPLAIPSGVRIIGGHDAEDWSRSPDREVVSVLGDETFSGSADSDAISLLLGFRVEGSISLGPQARVVLENNLVIPRLIALNPLIYDDDYMTTAVVTDGAFLRAEGNELIVDSREPDRVLSIGFDLSGTCARLVGNHLEYQRRPCAHANPSSHSTSTWSTRAVTVLLSMTARLR